MSLSYGSVIEVCYVTHNMEKAAEQWAKLVGAGPFYLMPMPETEFTAGDKQFIGRIKAALGFSGTTLVELIEPQADSPSIFQEVLDANGDGALHHVMTNVRPTTAEDFEQICAGYIEQGLKPVLEFEVPNHGRNTFFDARKELGAFIEVLQVPPQAFDMLNLMQAAHLSTEAKKPFQSINDLFA